MIFQLFQFLEDPSVQDDCWQDIRKAWTVWKCWEIKKVSASFGMKQPGTTEKYKGSCCLRYEESWKSKVYPKQQKSGLGMGMGGGGPYRTKSPQSITYNLRKSQKTIRTNTVHVSGSFFKKSINISSKYLHIYRKWHRIR